MSVSPRGLSEEHEQWLHSLAGGYVPTEVPPEMAWALSLHVDARALDPGISTEPMRVADVVEIAGLVPGKGDGPNWIAIVKLADARWVYVCHQLDITGDIYWTYVYAASRDRLWWWACTDEDRERFTAQLDAAEQADELVQLDMLLQSEVAAHRALGEARMSQLLRLGKLAR